MPDGMMPEAEILEPAEEVGVSQRTILLRRIVGHKGLLVGTSIVLFFILVALFAPIITRHDPYGQDLYHRLQNPVWYADGDWENPLGTDRMGRDYLTRLIYGSRVSLIIGFSAVAISMVIGCTLGIVGGYFRGRIDMMINYLTTVQLSMPVIIVALAIMSLTKGSFLLVIFIIGFFGWTGFAIVTRSTTQQIRSLDYIVAAQAAGCSNFKIIFSEILPNVLPQVIVVATLGIAGAILAETGLSFLGLGVNPPTPSWGLMVNEGKVFMFTKPWVILFPGILIFLLVYAMNMLGDGLRDIISPEGRN